MYATHVPIIRTTALGCDKGVASVCKFVLLSIRWPFGRLPAAVAEVQARGDKASALFGWKREGFAWIDAHTAELQLAADYYAADTARLIDYLAVKVPGLGIVKAAFVAQMLGHAVACFDSRNLETCDMPIRAFRGFKGHKLPKQDTRLRKINKYIQITNETGGAEHWWNLWCYGIAPSLGTTGEGISARHVALARAFL